VRGTALVKCAVGVIAVLSSVQAWALAIGDAMPASTIKLDNVDGRELTLGQVAGPKGTLVIFSCNHCPWVHAWEERLVAIGNTYGKRGLGVIAVNSNDPQVYPEDDLAQMKERARAKNYEFPYALDGTSEVGRAFGATHTPEAFLFNPSGHLVYHGAIDDNARDAAKVKNHYLQDALDAVLAGRRPAVQETKALGCTIVLRKQSEGKWEREEGSLEREKGRVESQDTHGGLRNTAFKQNLPLADHGPRSYSGTSLVER
jgi:hypothetical protein